MTLFLSGLLLIFEYVFVKTMDDKMQKHFQQNEYYWQLKRYDN